MRHDLSRLGLPDNAGELLKSLFGWLQYYAHCKENKIDFPRSEPVKILALMYLISEMVPEDRTTKHVFEKCKEEVK